MKFPGCGFWDAYRHKAPASRPENTIFLNKMTRFSTQQGNIILLTLAPIWFPHWPAWRCTISLIFFSGGRRDLTMNDFAVLYVRAHRLNSLFYTIIAPARISSTRASIGSFTHACFTDTLLDQSNVWILSRHWSNLSANHIHLKRLTNA